MSNSNIDPEDIDPILAAAGSLIEDVPAVAPTTSAIPPKPFVKPPVHVDKVEQQNMEGVFTSEQIIAMSKLVANQTRKTIKESIFDPNADAQVLSKNATPIVDFSKLSMDDVYDLNIPIEAKEFMSADALTIKLQDTNYEARWVNKNPQNLGSKIAKGFSYIIPNDLRPGTEDAIKASKDAQGHFVFDDVVAMKIDKATYYKALRAAHLRALATTNEVTARERAAKSASAYMVAEAGSDYRNAQATKKMLFYNPDIGV